MKKIILALTGVLVLNMGSFAQSVDFSAKVGVTGSLSNLQSTTTLRNESNQLGIGGYFGAAAAIAFKEPSSPFRLQVELLASYNSLQTEIGNNILMLGYSRLDVHSFYVPVLVKYALSPKFSFYAGPSVNLNFIARFGTKVYPQQVKWVFKEKGEVNKALNRAQFGLVAGAQYNISSRLFLDLRYQNIFPQVIAENIYEIPQYGFINNVSLGLGYRF